MKPNPEQAVEAGMSMSSGLKAGDEVWVVYNQRGRQPRAETIQKVGRKWATLGRRERFDIISGHLDGGDHASPGTVYPSQEHCEQIVLRDRAWSRLVALVRSAWRCPLGVTTEEINEAIRILGFDQEEV